MSDKGTMPYRRPDAPEPKKTPSPHPNGIRLIAYQELADGLCAMHVVVPGKVGWIFDYASRSLLVVGYGSWWYQGGMDGGREGRTYSRLKTRIPDQLRAKLAEVWAQRESLTEER